MAYNYRVLSLFANIGVAEACFKEIGVSVPVANELEPRRAALYQRIYPDSEMICGDITDQIIFSNVISASKKAKVNVVMATPPCQGMSTAGPKDEEDIRNRLSLYAFEAIKQLRPKYAIIENVPEYINTSIVYNGQRRLLTDILQEYLGGYYHITINLINTEDYGVPQSRERMIILLTDISQRREWKIPKKDGIKVTMRDAIGWIPSIDPLVKDLSASEFARLFPEYEKRKEAALKISRWNTPPAHVYRQVLAMQHTPTGHSAFDNPVYKPVKANGDFVRGYHNTYMRQNWDTPAYTVTMDNRKISSQGNVHPGRPDGVDPNGDMIYSDARTLTLFELMLIMSIPQDWPIPPDTPEAFLRRIIGEGIPPLVVKKLFMAI